MPWGRFTYPRHVLKPILQAYRQQTRCMQYLQQSGKRPAAAVHIHGVIASISSVLDGFEASAPIFLTCVALFAPGSSFRSYVWVPHRCRRGRNLLFRPLYGPYSAPIIFWRLVNGRLVYILPASRGANKLRLRVGSPLE